MDHSGKLFRTQAYRLSRTGIHPDQEAAARDLMETKADDEDELPWQVRAATICRGLRRAVGARWVGVVS